MNDDSTRLLHTLFGEALLMALTIYYYGNQTEKLRKLENAPKVFLFSLPMISKSKRMLRLAMTLRVSQKLKHDFSSTAKEIDPLIIQEGG